MPGEALALQSDQSWGGRLHNRTRGDSAASL